MSNSIKQLEEQIIRLRQSGQFDELANKYFELANLQTSRENVEAAAENYRHVLELSPGHIPAMNNLGQSLYCLGKTAEAMTYFEKTITLQGDVAAAHYNLANCLLTFGRHAEAITHYRKALNIQPDYPEAWYNLGIAYKDMQDYEQAAESFMAGLRLNPGNIDSWFLLGMMYQLQKRIPEAVTAYQEALTLGDHPSAAYNLGICMHDNGNYAAAIEMFHTVIAWQPNNAQAWNNLGRSLDDDHQYLKAGEAYERAVSLKPDFCDAIANLGNIWREEGQRDRAISTYHKALSYDQGHAQSLFNLGCCYQEINELNTAELWYRRSLEANPGLVEAHWNLSHVLLLRGEYGEGFKEYQWRWRRPSTPMPALSITEWHGEKKSAATLLIHSEQGFGDTIQFVRYLPLVRELVGRTIFVCEEPLIPLLIQNNIGADAIISKEAMGAVSKSCDLHAGLLALPSFFTTDDKTTIPSPAILTASEKLIDEYEHIFQQGEGEIKIGIVWQGSKGHKNDKNRSCPFDELTPLLNCPGTSFYSLQKQDDSLPAGAITNLAPWLNDFHHTAALIHHLDLVICVDTSVAHLAASMGKQVWLMLPFVPDWRWLLNDSETPWYPTMRLFRQGSNRTWSEVVMAMVKELDHLRQDVLFPNQAH